jgi:hypothetical protein
MIDGHNTNERRLPSFDLEIAHLIKLINSKLKKKNVLFLNKLKIYIIDFKDVFFFVAVLLFIKFLIIFLNKIYDFKII